MFSKRTALAAAWSAAVLASASAAAAPDALAAMPKGDVVRGAQLYEARCSACHSVDENRVGPRHKKVVGRKAGSVRGFEYSQALAKARFVWTQPLLERWLTDPEALVPGQKMGYRLEQAKDRQDVIAYLATLK